MKQKLAERQAQKSREMSSENHVGAVGDTQARLRHGKILIDFFKLA